MNKKSKSEQMPKDEEDVSKVEETSKSDPKIISKSRIIFEVQRYPDDRFRCKIDGISGGDEMTDAYAKEIVKYMIVFIEKIQNFGKDIKEEKSKTEEKREETK